MHIFVLISFAIGSIVKSIGWKRHTRNIENRRLVHVDPEAVVLVRVFKKVWFHKRVPKLLPIFVQKVNPVRFPRPTITYVRSSKSIFHPDTCKVIQRTIRLFLTVHVILLCCFFMSSLLVYRIDSRRLNMRICYNHKATMLRKYLAVHFLMRLLCKLF